MADNFPDEVDTRAEGTVVDNPFSLRNMQQEDIPENVVIVEDTEGHQEGDSERPQSESGTETKDGLPDWMANNNLEWLYNMWLTYPRLNGIFAGVVLPLICLIGTAFFFGQAIVWAEAAPELNVNDDALMEAYLATTLTSVYGGLAAHSLLLCLSTAAAGEVRMSDLQRAMEDQTMLLRETDDGASLLQVFNDIGDLSLLREQLALAETNTVSSLVGAADMATLVACGDFSATVAADLWSVVGILEERAVPDLTFHWNKCVRPGDGTNFANKAHPDAQREYYSAVWEETRQRIFDSIVGSLDTTAADDITAEFESARMASASNVCDYNRVSASWFWFSLMTSTGYGDVVPQTGYGRIFVYTAGFASILFFFGVLGNAGRILSLVTDDLLLDIEFVSFTGGLAGFLYWSVFFFGWMYLLAIYYQNWNDSELGLDVSTLDAYWFGFSSLTTLGLSDFTVQNEVLETSSFILYALLFLIGYLFLSSAFAKMVMFLAADGPEPDSRQSLMGRLKIAPLTPISDTATLSEDHNSQRGDPDAEREVITLAGTAMHTVRLDTHSVMTPMETVFTKEPKTPFSAKPLGENVVDMVSPFQQSH